MHNLLIDTSVWLDLVKDPHQQLLLDVLELLVERGEVRLIVPQTVVDEFDRNKARVVRESSSSLSSHLKRAKQLVYSLGDEATRDTAITVLSNVDHKVVHFGEAAEETLSRIEALFARAQPTETSNAVKLHAAQRAIDQRAPFHRQRNSINDAILIETYRTFVKDKNNAGHRFAFVTHNKKDFSHPSASDKQPHPDFEDYFSKIKSRYFISLAEALRWVKPRLVSDLMLEQEWLDEPRPYGEISSAIGELMDKVWYNRHWNLRIQIEGGEIEVVEKETFPVKDHATRPIQRDIWEGALRSAERVEKTYGLENLGPWDDFEWGMLNGKLSALRWVLGDEWDFLDI